MVKKYFSWWRATIMVAAIVAIVTVLRNEPTAAQFNPEQVTAGQSRQIFVDPPIYIDASALPVVSGTVAGPARMNPERYMIDKEQFEEAKRQAAIPGFGPQLPVTATEPQAPISAQTPGAFLSFNGDVQNTAGCGNWVPADQALAVGDGANPIIQAVNECLSVWNTAGARVLGPVSLASFFGMAAGTNVCDPRALFDWKNHRFIVSAITCSAPYQSKVAVSTADSAVGGWWIYTFTASSSGGIMDYPRMGQDHSVTYPGSGFPGAIYMAYNLFNPNYVHEEWHILPKGPMYAGAGFSYWAFWGMTSGGLVTDSTQPANVWSPYERPRAGYLVTSRNGCGSPCTALTVWAISNPFSFVSGGNGPQLTGVVLTAANPWTLPPNAVQLGSVSTIDTLDNRISGSVTYAHGHLHAAHSTANGTGGTATLLYKIQPFLNLGNAGCTTAPTTQAQCAQIVGASMRNETVLNYGGTSAAFMAVAQPDLDGNVSMVYNFARSDLYVGIAYISQRVSQPLGTWIDAGIFLQGGLGTYTSGRWGDYMAVAPVGVAYQAGNGGATGGNAMVFSGMYAGGGNIWRTRIGANIFTSVTQAAPTSLSEFGDKPITTKLIAAPPIKLQSTKKK